jgi:methyl-accepting chemotaxis protein-1 (serine sensor receptor)
MILKNLTLRAKLMTGFLALAVVVLLVSALAVTSLSQSNNRFVAYTTGAGMKEAVASELQGAAARRAIAVRDMLLVTDAAQARAYGDRAAAEHVAVGKALAELKRMVAETRDTDARDDEMVAEIARIEAQYGAVAVSIVKQASEGQRDEAMRRIIGECQPLLASLVKALDDFLVTEKQATAKRTEASNAEFVRDRWLLIGGAVVAFVLALGLGGLLSGAIVGPLRRAIAVAEAVAAGDLSADIRVDSRDETGQLMGALSKMNGGLLQLVAQIRQSADSISTASAEIASGNQDLSSRTEQQASALQQTAASMQQMTSTVQQTAESSRQASQLASAATEVAGRGGDVVQRVVRTMGEISDASRRIADIIGVIDSIAFQTNILALNAAVEAARAGEQGRGFAVVASEVRALAGRSAEAAREIKSLIHASAEKVDVGSQLVGEAGTTMGDIVGQVQRMTDLMAEINAAASEQSGGIGQVSQAVASIDQGTQQNAALVEQSAAAAESLRQQAAGLLQVIAQFRTGPHGHLAA